MNEPKISILTPTLNMGHYLEQCIYGVLCQNYSNWEHIVVDGGSEDATRAILEKHSHIRWISEPDRGLSDALNKAIRMARGDIIGWCNADDYYLPGAFRVCADCFQEDPALVYLYGDYRNIDSEGRPIRVKREIAYDPFVLKYGPQCYIATPAAFWRKTLHEDGLMFDENLHYSMDSKFILQCALAGYRFRHVSTLLCDFREHGQTKSASPKQHIEHEQIFREHLPLLRLSPAPLGLAVQKTLCTLARSKRTLKRALAGHYSEQWWRT
jgi:glycosyltransferase involved in cell wall biosynthesis